MNGFYLVGMLCGIVAAIMPGGSFRSTGAFRGAARNGSFPPRMCADAAW